MKDQLMNDLDPLLDIRNIKDLEKASFQVAVRTEVHRVVSQWINSLETLANIPDIPNEKKDYLIQVDES